jgi:hypothetical protein
VPTSQPMTRTPEQRAQHAEYERNRRATGVVAERKRKPCEVCGGPKGPGRGALRCPECWSYKTPKTLEELIEEQRQDMLAGDRVSKEQYAGNRVLGLGDHYDHDVLTLVSAPWEEPVDEWTDPTAEMAMGQVMGREDLLALD